MTDSTSTVDVPGYKAGTWVLDPSHSEVTFSLRHMMISKVRGEFGVKSATIEAPENPLEAKVTASVDAASISTNDENRDKHLRSADFFDVETYPTITFASTAVRSAGNDRFVVTGDLTIKDTTKSIDLDVELTGTAKDPFGNERLGLEGSVVVNRKDWGLTWNALLEAGGLLVSEKVALEFEVSAIKQVR